LREPNVYLLSVETALAIARRLALGLREKAMMTSEANKIWLIACLMLVSLSAPAFGQMGGGGGGPGQGVPMFDEPTFRDRVYENGGPQFRDSKAGKLITSVRIEGNRSVTEHKILSHMQSRVDRLYERDTFNRDIGELYRTGLFDKIEPYFQEDESGVQIRLVVREKPTVRSIVFHGNRALDDKQLKKHCGLDPGDPTGPSAVNAAKSRVIEYYQDQGFNSVDVRIASGDKPGDRDIVFEIAEGELERIWSIDFVGNQAFSGDLLKARIKSRDARSGITAYIKNKASHESLREDTEQLLKYYRGLGYFDARVDFNLDYDETGKWMYVTFIVSEGQQYMVRNIEVAGNQYFATDELMPLFKQKAKESFNQMKKSQDERLIRDLYGEKGFIFADIAGQVKYLPNHEVDILYSVAEGDVYRASDVRVHIEGDGHTQRRVVDNRTGNIRPGATLSSVEIERAERILQASAIFETNPQNGGPPRIEVEPPDQAGSSRK
jgi:outer membrane protein insertion porin family